MSVSCVLEIRRRSRVQKSPLFPSAVLVVAVALSISAQIVQAEQSVIGWIAAALPALGFLVMVKIALGRTPSLTLTSANDAPAEGSGAGADVVDVAELLPAARMARDTLAAEGRPLTRDALASHLRADGYPIRNARASRLLHALRQDEEADDPISQSAENGRTT
jgi:hypothetical protein